MCLAIPGKILSIDDSDPDMKMARVDFDGMVTNICIQWLPGEVHEGDYVLAHVGMALNKIDEEEARLTLEALREMGELSAEEPPGG
jgi:hydrogenase expression/formation protein HypC